ncbi:hypothetical protein [Paeniglutamicibacter terrestris]|uniref:Uncharacterized protein n=1 Tax=Paeniglutamicibacter terrestris TaxID=2723403 RepID=A0ABX1G542_9MICC|nr:hypothetical protein [Paeniglutamicibacter terrestris]NKG21084.1 hypothetical protein [Paeniglutamicibacter terrestris]
MIEITAAELSSDHLDKQASASWRGVWSVPFRLKTFESVTRTNPDGSQTLIQRTVIFANGTQITCKPHDLKLRIWL